MSDDQRAAVDAILERRQRWAKPAEPEKPEHRPRPTQGTVTSEVIGHYVRCGNCGNEHLVDRLGQVPHCPRKWSWGFGGPTYTSPGRRTLE